MGNKKRGKSFLNFLKPALIIIVSFLIYYPVFSSFFFMDDFYFLRVSQVDTLKEFIGFFKPVRFLGYRPLGTFIFFFLFQKLFDLNTLPYHIFTFSIHLANSWLVYKISQRFLKNSLKSWLISLIYAVSPLHFIGLYSIITTNFLIGFFFFLLSLYFWLKFEKEQRKYFYLLSLISFILTLFSSEIMLTLPLVIFIIHVKRNNFGHKLKQLFPFGLAALSDFLLNFFFTGPPITKDFQIKLSAFPSLFRWYILRAFGLPEGVKNGDPIEQKTIYLLFSWLLIVTTVGIFIKRKSIKENWGKVIRYLGWIIIAPFPFYFMPNHLNPIYFSLSFIAFLLLLEQMLTKRLLLLYSLVFIGLSFFSVRLLMHTHWTVKRSNLAKYWIEKTKKTFPSPENEVVVLTIPDLQTKEEVQITLQDDEALKVFYHNKNLKTVYKIK